MRVGDDFSPPPSEPVWILQRRSILAAGAVAVQWRPGGAVVSQSARKSLSQLAERGDLARPVFRSDGA